MASPCSAVRSAFCALLEPVGAAPLLVCVATGWLAGDLTAAHAALLSPALLAVGGGGVLLALGTARSVRVVVAVLGAVVGYLRADQVYRPDFPLAHIARAPTRARLHLEGVLAADPDAAGASVRLWLMAEQIDDGHGWRAVQGRVLLTLRHAQRTWRAGDRLRALVSLRHPRNFGNPGEFDYAGYLARRGVYVTAFAADDSQFRSAGRVEAGAAGYLVRWRRGVDALFHHVLGEPQASVLSALIVGRRTGLPRELRAAFSRAGVSHVLSISGLHVALVAAAGYTLFRWLLARSRWLLLQGNVPKLAVGLSLFPVLLYAGIAGTNVATTRSVIMILVFLGAVIVDRQRHMVISLAVAALIILLAAPGSAADISFQLSFVAVLGLVLAMERFWPWWNRWAEARLLRLRGWPVRLCRPAAVYATVSISALAATTPLTALHFNQVSFVAPLANAVVVPLLGSGAVVLGLLAALVYPLSAPLAAACVCVAGPCVRLGVWCVERFAALPFAAARVVTPTATEVALLYVALLVWARRSGRARTAALVLLALPLLTDAAWWYRERYHRADLRITFLSVGAGDCAVVEFPGAAVMVIDAGGLGSETFDVGERIVAPFLWSHKIAHVDYLVLSHPQWDHYGGMAFLATHFSPREFWSNGSVAASARFTDLLDRLAERGVRLVTPGRGTHQRIGGVEIAVCSALPQHDGRSVNDESLVFSLAFGGRRALFTGDIEAAEEERLVAAADGTLRSAILKVPHHGSHTSSTPGFLNVVAPRLAVISAGFDNRFGFPHRDVLRRYAAQRCAVARTDLDGAVQVRVDARGAIVLRRQGAGTGDETVAQIGR
jgi:competence protein ComEC